MTKNQPVGRFKIRNSFKREENTNFVTFNSHTFRRIFLLVENFKKMKKQLIFVAIVGLLTLIGCKIDEEPNKTEESPYRSIKGYYFDGEGNWAQYFQEIDEDTVVLGWRYYIKNKEKNKYMYLVDLDELVFNKAENTITTGNEFTGKHHYVAVTSGTWYYNPKSPNYAHLFHHAGENKYVINSATYYLNEKGEYISYFLTKELKIYSDSLVRYNKGIKDKVYYRFKDLQY